MIQAHDIYEFRNAVDELRERIESQPSSSANSTAYRAVPGAEERSARPAR